MSSSEPSSPSSVLVLDATTPIIDKKDQEESKSVNMPIDDPDPWAFLEKELEEFQKIVAELEQMKIQKSQPGMLSRFFL